MTCCKCDSANKPNAQHCVVCGWVFDESSAKKWDRQVEAVGFHDLSKVLDEDENLLGYTRGRIAGSWKRIVTLNLQTLISQYVNVGLTDDRLIVQQVNITDGYAASDQVQSIRLKHIAGISVSDADPFGANSMMRLSVTLVTGDSFRVRAPGRFGDHAKELAAVWKDISSAAKPQTIAQLKCVQCDRDLQKRFNYCPYCGVQQAPMDIIDGEDEV